MNCKPGDLAMVVAPYHPNGRGHFVTIERLAAAKERLDGIDYVSTPLLGKGWVCSGFVPDCEGHIQRHRAIADICLRPIRPDETPEESIEAMRLLTQIPQKEKV